MECTPYRRKTARSKWVPQVFGWANDDDAVAIRKEQAAMYAAQDGCEWKWFITTEMDVDGKYAAPVFDMGSKWPHEMGKEL